MGADMETEHGHNSSARHFSCEIPLRWGDMDAFGHVNNTLYLRYCEEARFQWLAAHNISLSPESYPVVVTIACSFLRPVFYPDTLRLECIAAEPGRSSFMAYYKIYTLSDPEQPVAEASSKIVWVDGHGKSRPLPESIRAWFATD